MSPISDEDYDCYMTSDGYCEKAVSEGCYMCPYSKLLDIYEGDIGDPPSKEKIMDQYNKLQEIQITGNNFAIKWLGERIETCKSAALESIRKADIDDPKGGVPIYAENLIKEAEILSNCVRQIKNAIKDLGLNHA